MQVGDCASKRDVCTYRAIVGALCARVSVVGPTKGLLCELCRLTYEGILLVHSEHRLFLNNFGGIEYLLREVSEVCVGRNELLVGSVLPVPCVAHDQNVVSTSEWVSIVGNRSENDFTLFEDCLISAAPVVVPLRDLAKVTNLVVESSSFRSEIDARAVDPNVFCNHFASLVKVEEVWSVLVIKVGSSRNHNPIKYKCAILFSFSDDYRSGIKKAKLEMNIST